MEREGMEAARRRMVEEQIVARGIESPLVLDAFRAVPRERFVDEWLQERAYDDTPLPIGEGQTISQPFVVALMIEAAGVGPGQRVLEVGAGSGYAAAAISRIADRVYAVERHAALGRAASERLAVLGYDNVELRIGDGTAGWREAAPFDAIIVSAGGEAVPPALKEQLAPGGVLVMPVGPQRGGQRLLRLTRDSSDGYATEDLGGVAFVPLVGGEA
ncbi:protein-L-isoaspartate(D-aspartate) O-methyltransferase [Neoaquamicrobium microcysteis]|nr:protein-L-isoaspartate(D-aspartate) O-methyltransferase [Mesorhizobium microcysteis]